LAYSGTGAPPGTITYVLPGDSAATIQSKMASVQPGNSLVFTGGATYDFAGATITGKSGVTVWADGQVVINNAPGAGTHGAFNFSGQTDWTIGGKAPGAGFVFNGSLVDATNASGNWAIGNCQFNNENSNGYDGSAIRMNGASFGTIINNDFTGVGGNVLGMYNLTNLTIDGNHFTNCVEPISIQEPTTANTSLGHDIVIQRNAFVGTQRVAIEAGPASTGSEYFSGLVINNNYFDNFNNTVGTGTLLAISAVGQSSQNTTITNNFIRRGPSDAGEVGVAIEMTGSGVVSGNTISNFSYATLTYQSGWNVHDNTVYNDGSSPYFGIVNNGSGSGTFGPETVQAGSPSIPAMPIRLAWGGAIGTGGTPPIVTEGLANDTGSSSTDKITSSAVLKGTADANAVMHFTVDGTGIAATASANASGAWSFNPTGLGDGAHTIVASETNASGLTGSSSLTVTLDTKAPAPAVTGATLVNSQVVFNGTSEAGSSVAVYDGSTLLGTASTDASGRFSFTTSANGGSTHSYSTTATDLAGNVGSTAGHVYLGSSGNDPITGTTAADVIVGRAGADVLTGGGGSDSFVYFAASDSSSAGRDKITAFQHGVDKIDFSNITGIAASGGVPQFQGQLASTGDTLAAHSVAYVECDKNTLILVNTSSSAETVSVADTHLADMKIVLVGVHLGLTASDFHHA